MSVDWNAYARQYDTMVEYNPAYQQLLKKTRQVAQRLKVDGTILDLGCGTGNFTLEFAESQPNANVIGLDLNEASLRILTEKAIKRGCKNVQVRLADMEQESFPSASLAGAVMVHSLYFAKRPAELLIRLGSAIRPGGFLFISDIGRELKVASWAVFIFWHSALRVGPLNTLRLFRQNPEVRKSNQELQRAQRAGELFLHTLPILEDMVLKAGFEILEKSNRFYRGIDDLIVARKVGALEEKPLEKEAP